MTNEERDLIEKFFARVGGSPQGFGSVPGTQPALSPIDPQADQLIAQGFQKYPEARYRITQMAVVQEAALVQAQNRIQQLQFQLQQAQQALQTAQQQGGGQKSGGFFGGLFGGGQQQAAPQAAPPPGWGGAPGPGYQQPAAQPMPYGMRPSMFQGGSGFLGGALSTATGVAGGMLAANALTSLFSGSHESAGGFGGGQGGETIINNNYGDTASADPFGGAGSAADQDFSVGGDSGGDFGGDWGGGDDQSF